MSLLFAGLDVARRRLGASLDLVGLGPVETPSDTLVSDHLVTLKAYTPGRSAAPVLLIVPAPIKRAYIWDLIPSFSAVRRCIEGGLGVYLIQWEPPGAREQDAGLDDYADRLILGCLKAIEALTGQPQAFLAGHSLGGSLAALFAALHPERVRGLVLIETPLAFSAGTNAFDPWVRAIRDTQLLTVGNVPGTILNVMATTASPTTFVWARYLDCVASILDTECLRTHLLVERWSLDEMALARRLFAMKPSNGSTVKTASCKAG